MAQTTPRYVNLIIEEEILISNKKILPRLIALLLVITVVSSALSSCWIFNRNYAGSKEELTANVEASSDMGYDNVTSYLRLWGFPGFNGMKFAVIEDSFDSFYNYGDGMPDTYALAKETAKLFIEQCYDTVKLDSVEAVTDALLSCYVMALDDPYSAYRPYEETEYFFEDMSGKFSGIGVMIQQDYKAETIQIDTVYPDSPAEKAGVRVGDYLIGIDGVSIDEIGLDNVVYRVRGETGTPVDLTLLRDGEEITVTAIRAEVEEINAYYEYDEESGLGYISIVSFKDNTFEQFKASVDALEELGAKGIVFDLRNNLGGYLDSVVNILSYVVPDNTLIISYRYKNSEPERLYSDDAGDEDHVIDVPMVVLCNQRTASAGEIFTAALRDYNDWNLLDATVVGTTTFGKGIMQSTFTYRIDKSSYTMTVAYYDPPCGVNYHGTGVIPDVEIELEKDGDNQLDGAYLALQELINANNN